MTKKIPQEYHKRWGMGVAPPHKLVSLLSLLLLFSLLAVFTPYTHMWAYMVLDQGGRTWQNFVGSKNGNENFRQACIYNFCIKCVVFARNRKFAKLTQ